MCSQLCEYSNAGAVYNQTQKVFQRATIKQLFVRGFYRHRWGKGEKGPERSQAAAQVVHTRLPVHHGTRYPGRRASERACEALGRDSSSNRPSGAAAITTDHPRGAGFDPVFSMLTDMSPSAGAQFYSTQIPAMGMNITNIATHMQKPSASIVC
uniref:Uncharacterized protein n=1 Tax=Anopheles melas TaxID=34690 RepID=A0A182UIY9_9DIPT